MVMQIKLIVVVVDYSKCVEIQGKATLVRVSEGSSYQESTAYQMTN